jgi:Flp pilus assembly pilin Flp
MDQTLEDQKMDFIARIKTFAQDEDGAVTVDWVVLTAAIVGLAIAVGSVLTDEVDAITTEIQTDLNAAAANDVTLADN